MIELRPWQNQQLRASPAHLVANQSLPARASPCAKGESSSCWIVLDGLYLAGLKGARALSRLIMAEEGSPGEFISALSKAPISAPLRLKYLHNTPDRLKAEAKGVGWSAEPPACQLAGSLAGSAQIRRDDTSRQVKVAGRSFSLLRLAPLGAGGLCVCVCVCVSLFTWEGKREPIINLHLVVSVPASYTDRGLASQARSSCEWCHCVQRQN